VGPDVTIGVDTVISAGAVVTSSLEANSIYKGNPAAFVKKRWE
jgi:acetyltransferase-like isoleucine patch superfamily enzyme